MLGSRRGDTLVEVMVAFAIFGLVVVSCVSIMNRGIAIAQTSLETTLVRQQIDSQAELLRFARDESPTIWSQIKANTGTPLDLADYSGSCPNTMPSGAFFLSIDSAGDITYNSLSSPASNFETAGVYSQFDVEISSPKAKGMWVIARNVTDALSSAPATDMHIGTCWNTAGENSRPATLGTIVRLYDNS